MAKHGQNTYNIREMYFKGLGELILNEIAQNVVLLLKTSFFLAI
jgi:hypothetical protein